MAKGNERYAIRDRSRVYHAMDGDVTTECGLRVFPTNAKRDIPSMHLVEGKPPNHFQLCKRCRRIVTIIDRERARLRSSGVRLSIKELNRLYGISRERSLKLLALMDESGTN
jgi:hypothetical protein